MKIKKITILIFYFFAFFFYVKKKNTQTKKRQVVMQKNQKKPFRLHLMLVCVFANHHFPINITYLFIYLFFWKKKKYIQ